MDQMFCLIVVCVCFKEEKHILTLRRCANCSDKVMEGWRNCMAKGSGLNLNNWGRSRAERVEVCCMYISDLVYCSILSGSINQQKTGGMWMWWWLGCFSNSISMGVFKGFTGSNPQMKFLLLKKLQTVEKCDPNYLVLSNWCYINIGLHTVGY